MDYQSARQFLINQTQLDPSAEPFLVRLQQGKSPVPGQVTSMLLALKVVFEALRDAKQLDRELVYALHRLVTESRQHFEAGQRQGILWTPLLGADLNRIAIAVKSIFAGQWEG